MYMNAYQKYIDELICEYGALLERQLTVMVNARFNTMCKNLNAYIDQMCKFSDYETQKLGKETIVLKAGQDADFDIIRSFEVMLEFMPNVIGHNKSRGYISIRFFVDAKDKNKEICVIPVKYGSEKMLSEYADDKFTDLKNEIVVFLLDNEEQINRMDANCNCRYAVVCEKGAMFFKK